MKPTIRPYVDSDFDTLVERWHATNIASYPYVEEQQKHSLHDARTFFRNRVLPICQVWVATQAEQLVGLLVLNPPWITHFAVFPDYQRRGVGTALLHKARECSPTELRLYTFQRNETARAFYEHHGFVAVAFGVSPAPESEPDVEYRWMA